MLFNNYPQIKYKLNNKNITLSDIFKNVAFTNVENNLAFDDYYIQEGETPEIVSLKVYGNTEYGWLILLVNSYADLKNDWFISVEEYYRKNETKNGGDAFYIQGLPDIVPGDIFVKVTATGPNYANGITTSTYRHVADFDTTLRKIRGVCGSGSFTGGDQILFARKTSTGTVEPIKFTSTASGGSETDYTTVLYQEKYGFSIDYFYDSNNVIIDPYKTSISGITFVNTNTLYSDPGDTLTKNNFASTLIYKYGSCGGKMPTGLFKKEIDSTNYSKYIDKQKIKVLRMEFLPSVITAIKNALQTNEIGTQFRIEI